MQSHIYTGMQSHIYVDAITIDTSMDTSRGKRKIKMFRCWVDYCKPDG